MLGLLGLEIWGIWVICPTVSRKMGFLVLGIVGRFFFGLGFFGVETWLQIAAKYDTLPERKNPRPNKLEQLLKCF